MGKKTNTPSPAPAEHTPEQKLERYLMLAERVRVIEAEMKAIKKDLDGYAEAHLEEFQVEEKGNDRLTLATGVIVQVWNPPALRLASGEALKPVERVGLAAELPEGFRKVDVDVARLLATKDKTALKVLKKWGVEAVKTYRFDLRPPVGWALKGKE